jgi:FkbM family methyltransferase
MNLLRAIYPLEVREKLYFRLVARSHRWPEDAGDGVTLEFVPTKMVSLVRTDCMHRQIAWTGFYDLALTRQVAFLARQGGLLVDVGANVGYFSCIWASLNPTNAVYVFEPSPPNLLMLRRNMSVHRGIGRIQIFDCALGKEEGEFGFDLGPEDESGWGGLTTATSGRAIQVRVHRLDDVIPADKTILVLKIDAEGADTWVLFGAEKTLRQKRIKNVFFESNPTRMRQLGVQSGEAEEFLRRVGYKVDVLGGRGSNQLHAVPE